VSALVQAPLCVHVPARVQVLRPERLLRRPGSRWRRCPPTLPAAVARARHGAWLPTPGTHRPCQNLRCSRSRHAPHAPLAALLGAQVLVVLVHDRAHAVFVTDQAYFLPSATDKVAVTTGTHLTHAHPPLFVHSYARPIMRLTTAAICCGLGRLRSSRFLAYGIGMSAPVTRCTGASK
jgi:hypothetical protein